MSAAPLPSSAARPTVRMVVGLGNPGAEYAQTRHNVGFELVDRLASAAGAPWTTQRKWEAAVAKQDHLLLVKPLTYMNLSGQAVQRVGSYHKIPPAEMLVVYDDADLPLGALRLRQEGSAGGHNGIKSLISTLGTDRFPRLKIGIGRAGDGEMVDHVLGRFSEAERPEVEKSLARAVDAVNCVLASGLEAAMSRFNQRPETARHSAPAVAPPATDLTKPEQDQNKAT